MGDGSTPRPPAKVGDGAIELVERESELSELDSLIAAAVRGEGSAVLIEGPGGIGKTSLRIAAGERARRAGMSVLSAHGGELEASLPWAVVRDLFVPALGEADEKLRSSLISGAAALTRPILEGAPPSPGKEGRDLLAENLHGLYWLTSNLSEQAPLLLAVDDAHWTDGASFDFLTYLAQRVADLPILLLVCGRPAEPGGEVRSLESLSARMRVLRPAPLSERGTEELVRRDRDQQPDAEFVAACHRTTGGNPYLLRELDRELESEGVAPLAKNADRVSQVTPEAIFHAVLLRLAALPEAAVRLAQSVAVLGVNATLTHSAALARVDVDTAASLADQLADLHVLGRDLPLGFVHPIVQRVVRDQIPAPQRARLHARAAELLSEREAKAEEIAVHLLQVEPAGDAAVVETLREAARDSIGQGAVTAAAEYLRRAHAEPPDPRQRPGLLVELAQAEAALADPRALGRLEEAVALFGDRTDRAKALRDLGWLLFSVGRHEEAGETLSRGHAELGGDEGELAAELRFMAFAVGGIGKSGLDAVRESSEAGPLAKEEPFASPGERAALTQLAVARVFAARAADEARELALRALGDGAMVAEGGISLTWSIAASCLVWCDDLDGAGREIDAAFELLRSRPSVSDRALLLFGRSWVGYWRGQIDAAAADAQAAVDAWSGGWGAHLAGAKWFLSRALIERGDLDGAERALELSPAELRPDDPEHEAWWRGGRGRLAVARGDGAAAQREFEHLKRLAPEVPFIFSPAPLPWRSDAAEAALQMGDRADARHLASEAARLSRSFGAARQLGIALRALGLAEGGSAGVEYLREAVDVLEGSPSRLELCRAQVELAGALRRQGAVGEARERLRAGLGLAQRLGARPLEERAHTELVAAGARPRRRELSGPDSLTPAERRVCELAASGATNREIAEQLFVSLRTVETHLTHAYQKLDISSREKLAEALSA